MTMTERSDKYDRINLESELDGIPRTWNPLGYGWTTPAFSFITHRTKPGVIERARAHAAMSRSYTSPTACAGPLRAARWGGGSGA
jgi:hypothetical protein